MRQLLIGVNKISWIQTSWARKDELFALKKKQEKQTYKKKQKKKPTPQNQIQKEATRTIKLMRREIETTQTKIEMIKDHVIAPLSKCVQVQL